MKHSTKTTPNRDYHANRLLADRIEKPDTLMLRVRRALQISQADMAARFDPPIHPDTVRRIESGKTQPNKFIASQLARMARAAKVPDSI